MSDMMPSKDRRNRMSLSKGMSPFQFMLDDFFSNSWPPMRGFLGDSFRIDVQDCGNDYCVEAELPGVKKEEIRIELNEGRLTIAVERSENQEEKGKGYIHRERRSGSYMRSIFLPDARPEGVKARLEDGVLKITVPREASEPPKKHEIPIE